MLVMQECILNYEHTISMENITKERKILFIVFPEKLCASKESNESDECEVATCANFLMKKMTPISMKIYNSR